jgi:hypothetical protein
MKRIAILITVFIAVGCGGKDDPKAPESALLDFPLKDSECTTGTDLTETTSEVEFRWQTSDHTETYLVRVTNLLTNNSQSANTAATSVKLALEKGMPYSWFVTSRNSNVPETATSEIWRFYNAGRESTYPPFPAQIINPVSGASVVMDLNNETELDWSGADVDNDISGYEVYLAPTDPPEALIFSGSDNDTSVKVSVTGNTVYYWRVLTFDGEGNSSDSGVFEFRVL